MIAQFEPQPVHDPIFEGRAGASVEIMANQRQAPAHSLALEEAHSTVEVLPPGELTDSRVQVVTLTDGSKFHNDNLEPASRKGSAGA
jgi:hypothetical protein